VGRWADVVSARFTSGAAAQDGRFWSLEGGSRLGPGEDGPQTIAEARAPLWGMVGPGRKHDEFQDFPGRPLRAAAAFSPSAFLEGDQKKKTPNPSKSQLISGAGG